MSDNADDSVDSYSNIDYIFKMILVGDSGVGKSSLLLRFADEVFQDSYICTIGVDLWDTAGQERFNTVCSHYYRGAEAVVFVYDVTDHHTFDNIRKWYQDVTALCKKDCMFTLIGNKSDMSETKAVSREVAQGLADSLGMSYYETSAKNSSNVSEAFISTTGTLVDKYEEGRGLMSDGTIGGIVNFSQRSLVKEKGKGRSMMSLNCFDCSIM